MADLRRIRSRVFTIGRMLREMRPLSRRCEGCGRHASVWPDFDGTLFCRRCFEMQIDYLETSVPKPEVRPAPPQPALSPVQQERVDRAVAAIREQFALTGQLMSNAEFEVVATVIGEDCLGHLEAIHKLREPKR